MTTLLIPSLMITAGLVLLAGGAEVFLKGAVDTARRWNISPLVIGLTVVAFGTSAPELAVSLTAAFEGNADITMGNIVGSNIANIGLIMGLGAIMTPLTLRRRMIAADVPLLLLIGLGVWAAGAVWGEATRLSGIVLMACYLGYAGFLKYWAVRSGQTPDAFSHEVEEDPPHTLKSAIFIAGGGVALVAGSRLLVHGAVEVALYFSISQLIIGLTLTAIGTSLPELATTIAAARKGHGDIVVGNVVGSNLANMCLVLGPTAVITPVHINSQLVTRDLPAMALITILMLATMWTGLRISRFEGILLLLAYGAYLWVIKPATG